MLLEGQVRIPSGCAISAMISKEGRRVNGEKIMQSMVPMHDRSNGLGGGFAAYGIYPEYRDFYALHIFYNDNSDREECERFLREMFEIVKAEMTNEKIPVPEVPDVPQTGDSSNLGFWIGLGAIALGGLIACGIMYIKRKKDDDDE